MGKDGNIGIDVSARPLHVPPEYGDYAERKRVFDLLEELAKDLVLHLPADPLTHIKAFLQRTPVPRIIVLGPLGSGRRELCEKLHERTGVVPVEVGEVVARAIEHETDFGMEAKTQKASSATISSDLLARLVIARLKEADCVRSGWVLWGFPRERSESVLLQTAGVLPSHVILLEGATEAAAARNTAGRLVHPTTKRMYHSVLNPPPEDVADRCEPVPAPSIPDMAADRRRFNDAAQALRDTYAGVGVIAIDADLKPDEKIAAAWPALSSRPESNAPWIPRVVVSGPPGSGDVEVADKLAIKYGVIAVHARDVLSQAVAREHPSSAAIRKHLASGAPLSDSVLTSLMEARLSQLDCQTEGWVVTGYPRTAAHALALDRAKLAPNRVFFLNVDPAVVRDRLTRAYKDESEGGARVPTARVKSAAGRVMGDYESCVADLRAAYGDRGVVVSAYDEDVEGALDVVDIQLVRPREQGVACM